MRKAAPDSADCTYSVELQWGRNLTVAEGSLESAPLIWSLKLQWGRNLTVAEGDAYSFKEVYADPLQWGRNLTVAEGTIADTVRLNKLTASMGPQLDSCGRRLMSPSMKDTSSLQWGRNLTVAEGMNVNERRPATRCFNGAAT